LAIYLVSDDIQDIKALNILKKYFMMINEEQHIDFQDTTYIYTSTLQIFRVTSTTVSICLQII